MEAHTKITDPLLAILALTTASIFFYLSTTNSFINIWTDDINANYSHGPLLLLVSAFLIFRIWQKNKNRFTYQPSLTGLIFILATSLLWLVAHIGYIQSVQQLALLFIIIFLFVGILGFRQSRNFLFPLLLILFAIPIWDFSSIYLRHIAVYFVSHLLDLSGVLSVSEDLLILIPAGTFSVTQGCSGQGQLVVALAISCIYTYIHPMRWYSRIMLIAAAIITAIITNVLRIYIVVMSGQYTNMQHYFVTTDHVTLGWVVFAIGMFIYFMIANRFLDFISPSSLLSSTSETAEVNTDMPLTNVQTNNLTETDGEPIKAKIPYVMILLIIIAVSSGPTLAYYFDNNSKAHDSVAEKIHTDLPDSFGGWYPATSESEYHQSHWRPEFIGADAHEHVMYQSINDAIVEVHKYHYNKQQQGKEAVSDTNLLYQDDVWRFISNEYHTFKINHKEISIEANVIKSHTESKKLVLKYYDVLGVRTSDPIQSKLLNIWGIITHRPDISVYVIATDIDNSYADSLQTLKQFISHFPQFEMK